MSEWISVKDKFPDLNTEVLAALKGFTSGNYVIRTVQKVDADDYTWESDGCEIANCWTVTHWMPLPDPPN